MTKQQLIQLITDNRLEEVADEILKLTENNQHLFAQTGILSASLKELKKKETTGQISFQEQMQKQAQITHGLLDITYNLYRESDNIKLVPGFSMSPQRPKKRLLHKYIWGTILGAGILIIGIYGWFYVPRPEVLETKPMYKTVSFKLQNQTEVGLIPKNEGLLVLNLPRANFRDTSFINQNGEAIFNRIPVKYMDMAAEVLLISEDYQSTKLGKGFNVHDGATVPVVVKGISEIKGIVRSKSMNINEANVATANGMVSTKTDNSGKFILKVPVNLRQSTMVLTASKPGYDSLRIHVTRFDVKSEVKIELPKKN